MAVIVKYITCRLCGKIEQFDFVLEPLCNECYDGAEVGPGLHGEALGSWDTGIGCLWEQSSIHGLFKDLIHAGAEELAMEVFEKWFREEYVRS